MGPGSAAHRFALRSIRGTQTKSYIPAARCARVVHEFFAPEIKGSGECRVPVAPAASCAKVESTRVVTTVAPGSPGIPARDGFTAYFALSLVIGLFCHHHPCDAKHHHELDASH
jgi:hypothetical protein